MNLDLNFFFISDAESTSPSHGSNLSEGEKNNLSSESADMSTADFEMAEKKRLAAERRKKLLDQVRHSEDLNTDYHFDTGHI